MIEHHGNATTPTRVVIMGAGGFVGSAAARKLEGDGVSVLGLTRQDVDLLADDAAEALSDRLQDGDSLLVTSTIAPCRNNAELLLNVKMMVAVCQAIEKRALSHVVYISSDAVYADGPLPLTEETCAAPTSLHGAMHVARETMLRATCDESQLCILRPTLLYGVTDPHNGYGPNRFRRLAQAGDDIVLFGNGEERRDHVLIEDVASIAALCLHHRSSGVLNVATGQVASFHEIAEMVAAQVETPPAIVPTERVGPMPHGGYRPFAIGACHKAFPEFRYTQLAEGIAAVHRATTGAG
jgi:UDP-glucose 4-epimerase